MSTKGSPPPILMLPTLIFFIAVIFSYLILLHA
jgi:hypothetical protein